MCAWVGRRVSLCSLFLSACVCVHVCGVTLGGGAVWVGPWCDCAVVRLGVHLPPRLKGVVRVHA